MIARPAALLVSAALLLPACSPPICDFPVSCLDRCGGTQISFTCGPCASGVEASSCPDPTPKVVRSLGSDTIAPTSVVAPGNRFVLLGSKPAVADPAPFGRRSVEGSFEGWLRGGLLILDTTNGATQLIDATSGLPKFHFFDEFTDYGFHTSPVYDAAWITPDVAALVALGGHVGRIELKNGAFSVIATHILRRTGATADARVLSVLSVTGALLAGTDQGVAALDPVTLDAASWLTASPTADPVAHRLIRSVVGSAEVVGVVSGPKYWVPPTSIGAFFPGDPAITTVTLPAGATPTDLAPLPSGFAISVVADGKGAVLRVRTAASPLVAEAFVSNAQLSASSMGAIVPARVTFDAKHGVLVVGGDLAKGNGVAEIPIDGSGNVTAPARDVLDRRDRARELLPWGVDVLAADSQGRVYIGGRQLCSERKAKRVALWRLERDGETRHLVKPWLGGVRTVAKNPEDQAVFVGFRDEHPAFSCDGVAVSQGLCRLRDDGACELYTPRMTVGDSTTQAGIGATSIAFGANKRFALATYRDATVVGTAQALRVHDTQISPKISLSMTRAAFGPDGALWLGSRIDWDELPGFDPDTINNRGPHGLGLLELDAEGAATLARRYVRVLSDQDSGNVGGLPSHTVLDVLPLPGTRRAVVACGIERKSAPSDHLLGEPSGRNHAGGIALVSDGEVRVVMPPTGVTFGDVKALAQGPAGKIFALDADAGVFAIDVEKATATLVQRPRWTSPQRGVSLAVDSHGAIVVGTNERVFLFRAGTAEEPTPIIVPFAWHLRFVSEGVLEIGADDGLHLVTFGGAAAPEKIGGPAFRSPDPWTFTRACSGADGCACQNDWDCADTFACACGDASCACRTPVACTSPLAAGCACKQGDTCAEGLECACEGEACACAKPPPPDCERNCTCATESGCPEGMRCQGGIAGSSCL